MVKFVINKTRRETCMFCDKKITQNEKTPRKYCSRSCLGKYRYDTILRSRQGRIKWTDYRKKRIGV